MTGVDKLFRAQVVFDVADQDRVELLVRWEAVGVLLVWLELGGRRLGHHTVRDRRPERVAIAAQVIDRRLGDVLEHRVASRDVSIQGAVAGRQLGLVAGAENDVAELVGQRVEDGRADPRLQILLGDPGFGAAKDRREDLLES